MPEADVGNNFKLNKLCYNTDSCIVPRAKHCSSPRLNSKQDEQHTVAANCRVESYFIFYYEAPTQVIEREVGVGLVNHFH